MSLVFNKAVSAKEHQNQYNWVANMRNAFNRNERHMAAMTGNAAAIIPQDVYREFDPQTVKVLRQKNLTLLEDLMPLSKSLPVGKIELVSRVASEAGKVHLSLSGQTEGEMDKTQYDYQSAIKVMHRVDYGRQWIEMEGQRSEGFDALIDDNENAVRSVWDSLSGHVYNGVDVSFNGTSAVGIKNSTRTIPIDLGASGLNINLATSTDTAAIRNAMIQAVKVARVDNRAPMDVTIYISADIESNLQRFYGTAAGDTGKTTLQTIKELAGVADVKMDESLSGNEFVMVALSSQFIRPLVGMAINTVPMFRANPMDNYNFCVWANMGLDIRADFNGRSGVFYAREIS